VAPFNGYVIEAEVRAGDLVKEGQPLSILDDRDLKIERLKWASQKEQLVKKYREAMAQHERAQIRILNAQIDQADAQIALIDEHLSRTRITAPFDSIVISGDLSQSLGAPVERGEVLFEVAPLDDYRIVLEVDEKDIDEIVTGQRGELVLSAMPDQILPFAVEKVTPVATAREGKNFFRVEAELHEASARLRPGMEGIGKINIDRRKLIWIWTHEVVDWIRLKFWALWP
jgi:RND family efflux transporter MFP subunit